MRDAPTKWLAALLLGLCGPIFGAGGGSAPEMPRVDTPQRTPEQMARDAYNAGVRGVEKADQLGAAASRQADEQKRRKAQERARQHYAGALKKFTRATELDPRMHEAWNYLGYTQRKLGSHEAALAAYDRALSLQPGYAQAIEYRGHAYLGLNRLQEAQQTYLTLFSANRALANQLLDAMQEWVRAHREDAAGLDAVAVSAFAAWVEERNAIAGPAAALTREGAGVAW